MHEQTSLLFIFIEYNILLTNNILTNNMQKMPLKIYINKKYGFLSRLPLKMIYSKNEFSSSCNVNLTFFIHFFCSFTKKYLLELKFVHFVNILLIDFEKISINPRN